MADDRSSFVSWVEGYLTAWNSNDPADIAGLFTADARYVTGPFDEPWQGRVEIVRNWLDRKDEPGTTRFDYAIVAVEDDTGVLTAKTEYLDTGLGYANVWIVRLDDSGECREFIEYWVERPRS